MKAQKKQSEKAKSQEASSSKGQVRNNDEELVMTLEESNEWNRQNSLFFAKLNSGKLNSGKLSFAETD